MPKFNEISDGGSEPNTPSVKQMRESQKRGSEGTGTDVSIAEKNARRNHGTGLGEGTDETFPEAGEYASEGKLPWE